MNYSDKDVIQALAAEYVLGTLRGRARDRFNSLKATREDVQQAVWFWESQLNDMALEVEPSVPRAEVWQIIQQKLGLSPQTKDDTNASTNVTQLKPSEKHQETNQGSTPRNKLYKWAVGLSSAACLVLAILLVNFVQELEDANQPITAIAIFDNADSQVLWSVDVKANSLQVKSTQLLTQQANNDYQLWIVPKSGDAPISIGLLPQTGEITIEGKLALSFDDIEVLAVSIEPLGGSPTGQPTTVLFAAKLVEVSS